MLLYIFTGTLFPYIEGLDSWLFEGTLDDPYDEVILIDIFRCLYAAFCMLNLSFRSKFSR